MSSTESVSPQQSLASLSTFRSEQESDIPRPSRRWGTRVLLPGVILVSFAAVLLYSARDLLLPAVDVRVVPVILRSASFPGDLNDDQATDAPVERAAVVQAPGWIEPRPFAIGVPALIDGVVTEVLVLEGEPVEPGQVVARLNDEELVLEEQAAAAMVHEREADIARTQKAVARARAQVLVDTAAASAAHDEVNRKRDLVAGGGVSPGEFRRLELRRDGLDAQVAASESAVAEAQSQVAQAQAALTLAQVSLGQAQLKRGRAEIRSTIGGIVLSRNVQPGMRLAMNPGGGTAEATAAGVVTLYDPNQLQVRADVPLADAAKVSVGTRAEITTEALPNATFSGTVLRIVHQADIQRNTVQFKVSVADPSPDLKPEMLTRVRFIVGARGPAAHPGSAQQNGSLDAHLPASVLINRLGDAAQVWLADVVSGARATARLCDVELGPESNGEVQIVRGVRPGDRAIANPPAGLTPGSRIRIIGEAQDDSAR
ncbi:MAG: efflux RND transporter periplasmic adaptor subunit [Phycisphaerales bacterium]